MIVKTAIVCIILLFVPQITLAAQKEWKVFTLPPTIETKQEVKKIPAGWVALMEKTPSLIAGITVFDGRPERKASLVPTTEEKQKAGNMLFVMWQLSPTTNEGIWITVSYSSTSVVLAQALPQGATELRVTYDTSVTVCGMNEIVRVEYR
jgi:hypothetical protein